MANEVGTITVRADTREVDKGTRSLRQMGEQSGRTEKQIGKVEKASGKLGRTLGRLAGAISVGLFARKVIENTREQEKAVAQLNATLRSTGRYSDETSQALQNQAAALQKLTTYGDESIITAQSQLLTFKELGNEVFPRATQAVLDMSAKMGTDLNGAVIQIGKALNSPIEGISALTRVGVTFSDSQKEMIKTLQKSGDILGAQEIILKELESQFKGSAEAARNTFGGALTAVSNAFNDLLEGKGGTIGGATEALNQLEETLASPEMVAAFQYLISAIATSVEWLAKGTKGFVDFGTGIGEFFGKLMNGPTIDDPAGIRKELEYSRRELKQNENAWIQWGAAEYNDKIRARIKYLEDMLALSEELNRNKPEPGAPAAPELPKIAGLDKPEDPDALLITVDNSKLKERLAKLSAELASDLRKIGQDASRELTDALAETSAELGGPAAEANLAYARSLEEIDNWEKALVVSNQLTADKQVELNQLRENAAQLNAQELEEIQARIAAKEAELTPTERLIESLQLELDLMKLGANEREREIVQRQLAGEATAGQLEQIDALILKRQEAQRSIETLDEIRGATQGLLLDLTDGTGSVGDAFDSMFDRIKQRALQMATEKIIESIFGAFGTAGGGAGGGTGGMFASLIGGLFGGGRAQGGAVMPDRIYRVNEDGPEMLTVGGREYLMPGNRAGQVTPVNSTTNNSQKQTFNINLPPTIPRRTAEQVAFEVQRRNRRATARNS